MRRRSWILFILFILSACKDDAAKPETTLSALDIESQKINYCSSDKQCVTTAQPCSCDPLVYNRSEDPSKMVEIQKGMLDPAVSCPVCKPSVYKVTCEESRCRAKFDKEIERVIAED